MKWLVHKSDSERKLVSFLQEKLGHLYSARQLKRAIEGNLCLVNGKVVQFAKTLLKTGDVVIFDSRSFDELPPKVYLKEKHRILYEDDVLLAYNKPIGLTSDESGILKLFPSFFLVHRLDRDTTGVILLAKTREAQTQFTNLFRRKVIKKIYLAIVDGIPQKKHGVIENCIGKKGKLGDQTLWGIVSSKKGKLARTTWEVDKKGTQATLIRCFPETGRTHQIRIHMKHMGHPILGDYRYARNLRSSYHAKRCLLHALELVFEHPQTGKRVLIRAPLPSDFKKAVREI